MAPQRGRKRKALTPVPDGNESSETEAQESHSKKVRDGNSDGNDNGDPPTFQDEIAELRQKIITDLQESGKKTSVENNELTQHIASSCAKIRSDGSAGLKKRQLSAAGPQLFAACDQALKTFKAADKALRARPLNLGRTERDWASDERILRRLLEYGHIYAKRLVGCMVEGDEDSEATLSPPEGGGNQLQLQLNEMGQMVVDQFEESREAAKGRTWGKVVRGQAAGFTRLVGGLDEKVRRE